MQYFSCGSDKYTEIKMCDLEPFSKIQSQFKTLKNLRDLCEIACIVNIQLSYLSDCSIRVY